MIYISNNHLQNVFYVIEAIKLKINENKSPLHGPRGWRHFTQYHHEQFFHNSIWMLTQFQLNIILQGFMDEKSALVYIIHVASCLYSVKALSNLEVTQFLYACVCVTKPRKVNSLAPGRSECDSKNVIFNLVLLIGIFRSAHDNALRLMSQDLTGDRSTLVQVMAWCG